MECPQQPQGSRQAVPGFNHSKEDFSQRKRFLVAKIIKDSKSWPTGAVRMLDKFLFGWANRNNLCCWKHMDAWPNCWRSFPAQSFLMPWWQTECYFSKLLCNLHYMQTFVLLPISKAFLCLVFTEVIHFNYIMHWKTPLSSPLKYFL